MASEARAASPPAFLSRPHTGAARRWRVLGVMAAYAAVASGILFTTGTMDVIEGLRGLHLLPLLLAVAASLIFAAPAGARTTRRHMLASLGLAAGVGTIVTLAVAVAPDRPWWLGRDLYYADLLLGLRRASLAGLLVTAVSCAAVPLPLLLVRQKSGELGWQALGGMIAGLGGVLLIVTDVVFAPRIGLFAAVISFGVLGVGSFLADRWVARGRSLGARAKKPMLRLLALTLMGALVIGPVYHGLSRLVLRANLPLRMDPELEATLVELQGSLEEEFDRSGGIYPSSLGELPGLAGGLAGGLTRGYAIRYGRTSDGWSLAADPVEHPGEAWACYSLAHAGALESSIRPFLVTRE